MGLSKIYRRQSWCQNNKKRNIINIHKGVNNHPRNAAMFEIMEKGHGSICISRCDNKKDSKK
jgi:hypothetical protein